MDRLNRAAISRVASVVDAYAELLLDDISGTYGVPRSVLVCTILGSPEPEPEPEPEPAAVARGRLGALLLARYQGAVDASRRHTRCAWFTKRGEPCHKERRHSSDYCSVHAEYFDLQRAELLKVKAAKDRVNVTRRGIHKGCCGGDVSAKCPT